MSSDSLYKIALQHDEYSKKLYWPVYRWEVVMPEYQPEQINAFERLFLELIAAGADLSENFCERIGIGNKLRDCIFKHLFDNQLVSKQKELTEKGRNALAEKDYFGEELQAAKATRKIFLQDAISGNIIPFSFNEEPDVENVTMDEMSDAIVLKDHEINPPNKRDILNGIKQSFVYSKPIDDEWEDISDMDDYQYDEDDSYDENENTIISIRIIDSKSFNKYYLKFEIAVNPLLVTNNEIEYIWEVHTPFGVRCNDWFEQALRSEKSKDLNLSNLIDEDIFMIRESMKGKVAFRNELSIPLFNEYPEITLDEYGKLKKRIEELELARLDIDNNKSQNDTWLMRLSKALERVMKYHLSIVSLSTKQKVASWVNAHKGNFKESLKILFDSHQIVYQYRDANYIKNDNITVSCMLDIANGRVKKKYKKDIAVFMLIVSEVDPNIYWNRLIENYSKLYEAIGRFDYMRNMEGAHDNDEGVTLTGKDVDEGSLLLKELVASYFEEVRRCKK